MNFKELNDKIMPLDDVAMKRAKLRWDNLAKPLSSLGKLETAVIKTAGIQKTEKIDISNPVVCVMCADNGVVAQGVTQVDSSVTAVVAGNMAKNESTVCVMAKSVGADVCVVDVGMIGKEGTDGIIDKKVMYGTNDITLGPAMSEEEAVKAIYAGIDMAKSLKEKGYNLIMTGEMGIGNTTTSSAVAAVMLNKEVEEVTGRGAGLSNDGLKRKIGAIKKAIEINKPDRCNALDVLQKVGGLDIAAMAGLYIGGAMVNIPVMIDGFISAVSALIAKSLVPNCYYYMLPSHVSAEPAGRLMLDTLSFEPMVTCDMCLGEGTGAVAAYSLLKLGSDVYYSMSSFEEANIEKYERFN